MHFYHLHLGRCRLSSTDSMLGSTSSSATASTFMEKYSRWRDPSTGIQPMVPIKPLGTNRSAFQTLVHILKSYIVGPPLAIIKVTAIMLLIVAFGVLELAGVLVSGWLIWFASSRSSSSPIKTTPVHACAHNASSI